MSVLLAVLCIPSLEVIGIPSTLYHLFKRCSSNPNHTFIRSYQTFHG